MKTAAVIIPSILLALPLIALICASIWRVAKSEDGSKAHRLSSHGRQSLIVGAYLYTAVLFASICWTVNVFAGNSWIIAAGILAGILIIIIIVVQESLRLSAEIPNQPLKKWQDRKPLINSSPKLKDPRPTGHQHAISEHTALKKLPKLPLTKYMDAKAEHAAQTMSPKPSPEKRSDDSKLDRKATSDDLNQLADRNQTPFPFMTPEPPPGGWLNKKAELDAWNKLWDTDVKTFKKWLKRALIIVIIIIILLSIANVL